MTETLDRGWILEPAADMVARFEGFSPKPYKCPGGHITFGFGSLIAKHPDVKLPINIEGAREYLIKDLQEFLGHIDRLVKVELNTNQLVALLSFVYNLGQGALERSTLLKLLNEGKYSEAADEFLKWDKANVNGKMTSLRGLSIRREQERKKFLEEVPNGQSEPSKPLQTQRKRSNRSA